MKSLLLCAALPSALLTLLAACGDGASTTEAATGTTGAGGATSSVSATATSGSGGGAGGGPSSTSAATTTSGSGGAGGGAGGAGTGGGEPVVCPADALVPGIQQLEIAYDGKQRQYEIEVPLGYDNGAPVPLVFDFHGFTSNKDQQEMVSGFSDLSGQHGFVLVRVDGFASSWNAGDFCCGQAQQQALDDVGLVRAIVTEVSGKVCVDPKRVYSTGISNGGALSHRLACEAADVFAAVAPVSYPIDFDPLTKCQPSRPIAVMHLHGKNDLIVPYDGSAAMVATPESFAHWASVNGCTGQPVVTYQNDDSLCETYETCDAGVQTALCSIDGGHVLYVNSDSVPVAELAWQFLSKHTLP